MLNVQTRTVSPNVALTSRQMREECVLSLDRHLLRAREVVAVAGADADDEHGETGVAGSYLPEGADALGGFAPGGMSIAEGARQRRDVDVFGGGRDAAHSVVAGVVEDEMGEVGRVLSREEREGAGVHEEGSVAVEAGERNGRALQREAEGEG